MRIQIATILVVPLNLFVNDTLNIKASFTFSSEPSKFYQEPKFIEVEIRNETNKDFYFAAGNLMGKLDLR